MSANSNFQVNVRKSYFKGNKYLIQAQYDKKIVFFDSLIPMEEGQVVGLEVGYNVLQKRIKH